MTAVAPSLGAALRHALVVLGATCIPTLAIAQDRLEVDLSRRELYVYEGKELRHTYPVAIGKEGHRTPTGDMTIDRIIWNPDWVPPDSEWARDATRKAPGEPGNPMRGAKLFFRYPAYYIHGTNEPETLGEPASHGCLRMRTADVEQLAEWVQKAGGADRGERWFDQVRAMDTEMREVELPRAVPIEIHW